MGKQFIKHTIRNIIKVSVICIMGFIGNIWAETGYSQMAFGTVGAMLSSVLFS